jgi:short-subunit dehydrogenase
MKRVLIIGATSAIAMACSRLWARQHARLFLVGRDREKLRTLATDLSLRGAASVGIFEMCAEHTPRHATMLEAALQALGPIDVALIAHGSLPDQRACEADADQALREFAVNGTSFIALLTVLANHLEAQGHGAIGVITSVAGVRGRPSNYLYGSAKAAVSAFCEGLRVRLYRAGVTLTDIRPGFVATPMTEGLSLPGKLVAQPETVARRIVAGIDRGRDILYAPSFWGLIMAVIRHLPRCMFKRMNL